MAPKNNERQQAIRAALKIHEHLLGPLEPPSIYLPRARWEELVQSSERLRHVQRRGWQIASTNLALRLTFGIRRLAADLERIREQLPLQSHPTRIAPASSILADLQALPDEFEGVSIDLKEKTIRVSTAPIELKDVCLGPFAIVLHWECMGGQAYHVIAEDPKAANDHAGVTHPHVRDEELCEGEGKAAIQSALATGRLLDFFLLVRQVLQTYNPGSAYVALSDWEGKSCHDCGYTMPSEESYSCDSCQDGICSDCSNCCQDCRRYVCSGCSSECAGCEQLFCSVCLPECEGSSQLLCSSCLEKAQGDTDDEEESATEPAADALCVGEAIAVA